MIIMQGQNLLVNLANLYNSDPNSLGVAILLVYDNLPVLTLSFQLPYLISDYNEAKTTSYNTVT